MLFPKKPLTSAFPLQKLLAMETAGEYTVQCSLPVVGYVGALLKADRSAHRTETARIEELADADGPWWTKH